MSFRGKHVQAPKVPQRFSSGASVSSRALWPSWSNSGGEQHGVVTWPGLPSKLSATNSHWRKRVGQKQAVLLATICFISAVNESVQPVVVGTKSFSQLLYMEKLHCIHRQENSSLPGICKKCILQTVVCKVKDGHYSNPSIACGWELFQSIHCSRSVSANRAGIDPSRQFPSHVFLRIPCRHT